MEEATAAFPDLSGFEFFVIILQDSSDKLRLPDKFARLLDGQEPREVTLREASGGRRVWDVEVVFDGVGHVYLERGWEQFARVHGLELGHLLVFSYNGDAVLTVKVFDLSMCRRHYHEEEEDDGSATPVPRSLQPVTIKEEEDSGSENSADSSESSSGKNSIDTGGTNSIESGSKNSNDSGSKSSSWAEMDIDDAPTSQFTVMLRQCNLGVRQKQYLNVPVDFQIAHEYHRRSKVVLRMGGKSWPVTVKRTGRPATGIARAGGNPRTSLRYGWHQFCVDNRLGVGDTCFFRALRGSDGEDHELKVEVRRRDGTFVD